MRVPRVRFTVRRMMVAVAIVAVIAYGIRLRQLVILYRNRTVECEWKITRCRLTCFFSDDSRTASENERDRLAFYAPVVRRGNYYQALKAKYERAARYPFLPVAPDPPKPE